MIIQKTWPALGRKNSVTKNRLVIHTLIELKWRPGSTPTAKEEVTVLPNFSLIMSQIKFQIILKFRPMTGSRKSSVRTEMIRRIVLAICRNSSSNTHAKLQEMISRISTTRLPWQHQSLCSFHSVLELLSTT